MKKQRGPRFNVDQPVIVTVLGSSDVTIAARVANASAKGLGLVCSDAMLVGTAIKIELEDAYVLGEAVYCHEEPAGWIVGVELSQVLDGLSELARWLHEYDAPELSGRDLRALNDRLAQDRRQREETEDRDPVLRFRTA